MKTYRKSLAGMAIASLVGLGFLFIILKSPSNSRAETALNFDYQVLDAARYGLRAVGDINGDNYPDIVARIDSGNPYYAWYEYPSWQLHTLSSQENFRSDDLALADIDGDSDLDLVAVIGEPGQVYWYENPRPGDPTQVWSSRILIGQTNGGPNPDSYVKDLVVDDFTGDNQPDVVARTHNDLFVFRQDSPGAWTLIRTLTIHDHEGMDSGDLDQDGDPDVVLNGFWLETPNNPASDPWNEYDIDDRWWTQTGNGWMDNNAKVHVVDINGDNALDVLICHSELPDYPVSWYESANPRGGTWTEHPVTADLDYCHSLQTADFNRDGHLDVLAAEMPKSSNPDEVNIYLNSGDSLTWSKLSVATSGAYSAQVGDLGLDGDFDIVSARDWDSPPLEIWENVSANPFEAWTYIEVDDARQKWGDFDSPNWLKYFGLAMGDLTGDGFADIVSGRYFYRNPGGDMGGSWNRTDLGLNVDGMVLVDVDGDALGDAIGQALPEVYWLEAADTAGSSWNATVIGSLTPTGHVNGQGYTAGQIVSGGKPEVLLGSGDGIYYFEIPGNPQTGNWPKTRISSQASDTAIGLGDIDGDGRLDVAGVDATSANGIAWWKNPGNGTGDWQKFGIGEPDGDWPDRVAVADLNGDGRPDIIVTEEEQPVIPNYKTYWFEAPADPTNTNWTRHTVVTQYTTNSLDVVDFDHDGDWDLVTGEHRGTEKVAIWENDGSGSFTEHVVDSGKESHLGARVADLNGDGAYEILSIAWDDYPYLHLWRNDALSGGSLVPRIWLPLLSKPGGHSP